MSNEITETDKIDEELSKSLAIAAKEEASKEKSDIRFLSIKGSRFSLGEEKLGRELNVVILASAYDNAYYDMPYDPDVIRPPACFAISTDSNDMSPHEIAPDPQSEECSTCEHNQFGSSGKGKACKNGRRLILASYETNGVNLDNVVTLRIPPTSLKNYSSYVRKMAANSMPVHAISTLIHFDENETYPKIMFKSAGVLSPSEITAIAGRRAEFMDLALVPYDVSAYTAPTEVSSKLK